ncbi:MAG TPA: hypothetical protein VMF67_08835 [Rhizomicrobium sp.]|nr:hypothetical protein [Rhizomicrobium sp.]
MHSALFVAFPQKDLAEHQRRAAWGIFIAQFEAKTSQATNVVQIAANVWLVDLTISPGPLGYMITAAENQGLEYGILPFEKAPDWLPVGFVPRTNQG